MSYNIGESISELRAYLNITQKELAEGICTQTLISKIEKEHTTPSAVLLYELAEKMGVDINYFFEQSFNCKFDYIKEVQQQVREAIKLKNYSTAKELLNIEKNNPLFMGIENKQFILWNEGIIVYYLEKNTKKALSILNQSLELRKSAKKTYGIQDIEILNSIGIIHGEENLLSEAISIFDNLYNILKQSKFDQYDDIKIKILYNYAKELTRSEEYEKAKEICLEGVRHCMNKQTFYLLGNFYYQIGYIEFLNKSYKKALFNFTKASEVFNVSQNSLYLNFTNKKIEEIKKIINAPTSDL
ncbi:helix-turn-helix domain-containing protein [Bacillus solimangrovi]|uniref:HTH cro/C1-type domain-containing protein n=1 Tax=Bacillus solimangrovi TaxID=1305675 RepID=A0A1E5LJK3_9BACI|nr:helix-turn-helix domain-containing protein [Bacillus solimangrovi]OEH94279.1 hypothetical protein BFG57_08455 [Bacillus solimangrovi]